MTLEVFFVNFVIKIGNSANIFKTSRLYRVEGVNTSAPGDALLYIKREKTTWGLYGLGDEKAREILKEKREIGVSLGK